MSTQLACLQPPLRLWHGPFVFTKYANDSVCVHMSCPGSGFPSPSVSPLEKEDGSLFLAMLHKPLEDPKLWSQQLSQTPPTQCPLISWRVGTCTFLTLERGHHEISSTQVLGFAVLCELALNLGPYSTPRNHRWGDMKCFTQRKSPNPHSVNGVNDREVKILPKVTQPSRGSIRSQAQTV